MEYGNNEEPIFVELLPHFLQDSNFRKSLGDCPKANELFKMVSDERLGRKEKQRQIAQSKNQLHFKIIDTLQKKLGRMTFKKYEEYIRISNLIQRCQKQKHFRNSGEPFEKVNSKKARVLSAKPTEKEKRVFSACQANNLEIETFSTKKRTITLKPKINQEIREKKIIGCKPKKSQKMQIQGSSRKLCRRNKENMINEKLRFENQLKGIMKTCEKEKSRTNKLKKSVENFQYFCSKVSMELKDKCKRFSQEKNDLSNLYDD